MTMSNDAVLALDEVTKQFGGLTALDRVSMTIREDELDGLIGPNGAGKSTLVNCITGVYPVTSGEIRYQDEVITGESVSTIARRGILRTFQKPNHFEEFTARENLEVAGVTDSVLTRDMFFSALRDPEPGGAERFDEVVDLLDIPAAMLEKEPADMNHLELRKLAIGRVLVNDPSVLLLDEPFAGLTSEEMAEVAGFVTDIRDSGVPVMLIDHNVGKVSDISDRVVVLHQGEILKEGTPTEIMDDEQVRAAYFGE